MRHERNVFHPNVIFFGEPMAPDFHRAAIFLRQGYNLLLVMDSSLTVYPAASLLDYARQLIIFNREPTPAMTGQQWCSAAR